VWSSTGNGFEVNLIPDQMHDDVLTEPSDVQTMFDNIPVADKKLQARLLRHKPQACST
jgi:hypothetical protein